MAVPARVAKPTASNVTDSAVTVNWRAPAANGPRVDRYRVRFYRATGTAWQEHEQTTRSRRYSGLDPNTVYRARVQARNADGWGPWSDYLFVTTRIGKPVGPDAPEVVQVNDGRHILEWVRNASADRPYASERVLRQDFGPSGGRNPGGSWGNVRAIGTVTGQAPRFTDDTTQPNRAYAWWIEARNSTGSTRSATSGTFRTTPAAPSGLVATKAGTSITVTYSQEWPGSEGVQHEFEVRVDGAPAVAAGTVNADNPLVFGNVSNSLSYEFRARTSVPAHGATGPRLFSAWSEWSNLVPPGGPPLVPTPVFPDEQDLVAAGEPVIASWRHNSTDTSLQEAFEIEWKFFDNSLIGSDSGGEENFFEIPSLPPHPQPVYEGMYMWRVRTRGDSPQWSPWTEWALFVAVGRPQVVIQSPVAGAYAGSQVEVVWDYTSFGTALETPFPQGAWEAELLDADLNVLESGSGSGETDSVAFRALLSHDATYTVRVRAQTVSYGGGSEYGAGLWSEWDQVTFTPEFPLPAEVRVHAEWDTETGSVPLTFDADTGAAYVWTGTPNGSMSEKKDGTQVIARNWWPNPKPQTSGLFPSSWTAGSRSHAANPSKRAARYAGGSLENVTIGPVPVNTSATKTWRLGFFLEVLKDANVDPEIVVKVGGTTVMDSQLPLWGVAPGTWVEHDFEITNSMSGDLTIEFTSTGGGGGPVSQTVWIGSLMLAPIDEYVSEYFDGDTPDTASGVDGVDVQRNDGGGWVTIAIGLDPETSTVDYTPRLGTVRYRAISRTDLPAARLGPETVIEWEHTGRDPIFVNGGEAFETVRTAIGHEVTDSPNIEQDSQQWAGWAKPTPVFGEGESDGIQFQGNIIPHLDDARASRDDWKQLLKERRIVCYRDCQGRKMFGLLHVAFNSASSVTRLTLDITQTHHVEGIADQIFVPEIVDPS